MRFSQALGRSVSPVVTFLALAASAPAQQILEVYADSLSTYLPAATAVNVVRLLKSPRGVNIDGSWRASPSLAMQVAGNPSENAWTGKLTNGPLRIDIGGFAPMDVDIGLPTTGPQLAVARTHNSLQLNSGGSSTSKSGPQGVGWMNTFMPEFELYTHPSDSGKDELYLVYGADRFTEYRRWIPSSLSASDQFKGVNGATGAFDFTTNGGDADTYTLTDGVGNKSVFSGFDGTAGVAADQVWRMTDPAGNTAYVGHPTTSTLTATRSTTTTTPARRGTRCPKRSATSPCIAWSAALRRTISVPRGPGKYPRPARRRCAHPRSAGLASIMI